jgi:hypothetical protein
VRKLPTIAFAGVAGLALAGTAVAAARNSHIMNVPLPDGSVARVEYVGDVAPRVTLAPVAAPMADWGAMPFPSFAGFDRMMADINRQTEAMMRQAQQMARQPAGMPGAPIVASFGNAPAGVTSTTVVSYSNGNSSCTRTTETISQGPGKPPKVTTSVSGNCAAGGAPARPAPSAAPINRT